VPVDGGEQARRRAKIRARLFDAFARQELGERGLLVRRGPDKGGEGGACRLRIAGERILVDLAIAAGKLRPQRQPSLGDARPARALVEKRILRPFAKSAYDVLDAVAMAELEFRLREQLGERGAGAQVEGAKVAVGRLVNPGPALGAALDGAQNLADDLVLDGGLQPGFRRLGGPIAGAGLQII